MKLQVHYQWVWLVLGLFLMTGGWAYAHAGYDHSQPAADAVLSAAPASVQVWFVEELFRREGANLLAVFDSAGNRVDQGDSRIDDDDRGHMIVSLKSNLPDGHYTVYWQTASADDGDEDNGQFSFTVKSTAAAVAAVTQIKSVAASETTTPATETSVLAGSALPCLGGFIIAVLVLGFAIAPAKRKSWSIFL